MMESVRKGWPSRVSFKMEKPLQNLMEGYTSTDERQFVHIATDGESYGHHHSNGDMALAYCIRHIEENQLTQLTNYGQYLAMFDPEYEVEIHENSSWSCAHGVERWRSNCGCHTGGEGHWNQNGEHHCVKH